MPSFLQTALLTPVILPQAIWTALRASRLPEAAGPREGRTGSGPSLRVLVTGDSSAAGVGADTQKDALAGQIGKALSPDFTVNWQVIAKSGGTAKSTLELLRDTPPAPCDIAVVALGVNDTKNGVAPQTWRQNYSDLIALLCSKGTQHVYVSGLPPLGEFPLLPNPLRRVLGARALRFDAILSDVAQAHPSATHVPTDFDMDPALMAADGFHPGPAVYAGWADLIRDRVLQGIDAGTIKPV